MTAHCSPNYNNHQEDTAVTTAATNRPHVTIEGLQFAIDDCQPDNWGNLHVAATRGWDTAMICYAPEECDPPAAEEYLWIRAEQLEFWAQFLRKRADEYAQAKRHPSAFRASLPDVVVGDF